MMKYGILAFGIAALDQLIKANIRQLPLQTTFFEIPGLFSLVHCVNTGAAFSALSGHTLLLIVLSLALLAAIWMYAAHRMHLTPKAKAALSCLIGGGLGNLLDRMLYSEVTDYIRLQFIDFPVFNLADIAITGAVAVLMILLFSNALEETLEENDGSDD